MQTEAIISAACKMAQANPPIEVMPEIMIPLVGSKTELDYLEKIVRKTAAETMQKNGVEVKYMVGTMIEIPRAALIADSLAETAEFFSFGTNDLTQMTFGFSRDDIGSFLTDYMNNKILPEDPFEHLDQTGVGQLIQMGVERGRKTRPNLKCGICGEHGGDPVSVEFSCRQA